MIARPARIDVARLDATMFGAWRAAYEAYAILQDSPIDDAIAGRVWAWLVAADHPLEGFAAFADGRFAGFAHVRSFPRTLDGNEAGFLDDLYVLPDFRGSGVVRALFLAIEERARECAWTHVRWVSIAGNAHANRLYEKIAKPVDVRTFRLDTSDRR